MFFFVSCTLCCQFLCVFVLFFLVSCTLCCQFFWIVFVLFFLVLCTRCCQFLCPFLIVISVFSNVYDLQDIIWSRVFIVFMELVPYSSHAINNPFGILHYPYKSTTTLLFLWMNIHTELTDYIKCYYIIKLIWWEFLYLGTFCCFMVGFARP
jgi:hypothetical protein